MRRRSPAARAAAEREVEFGFAVTDATESHQGRRPHEAGLGDAGGVAECLETLGGGVGEVGRLAEPRGVGERPQLGVEAVGPRSQAFVEDA